MTIERIEGMAYATMAAGGRQQVTTENGTKVHICSEGGVLCLRLNGGEPKHFKQNTPSFGEDLHNFIAQELAHD
ncbi:hypothetical protein A2994_00870 [candidate division Kazan bacterium RIFCSPLOWO2_01_FULL_48_13]|uniref:Uncharacterized protein n=1 Tax=candidate division Kazan bacterium RIFCSPLOWO2_01_FULL_48_13 TaxID=1798539 RepID=A0A1F4PR96_UNCK3|nr:MAG: hypothetical protein A2994_00870 [candidate division Kazan bacterium RIFCSPLOWO2_01_FULL_48_13]